MSVHPKEVQKHSLYLQGYVSGLDEPPEMHWFSGKMETRASPCSVDEALRGEIILL